MLPMPGPEGDPRKYVRLAAELRMQIEEGGLPAGHPVPSITRLAAERGWARGTCAGALQLLAEQGLLRRVPGLGYYVTAKAP
jgi:DNA-binding GntR family transcriptional regulator